MNKHCSQWSLNDHILQGCYAQTLTIKVPDNAEVRENKRRDFRRRKFAMHKRDVEPRQRSQ